MGRARPRGIPTDEHFMSLALQRLLSWTSPSFPIGAFSFSGGLEAAISQDAVTDRPTLIDWLDGQRQGGRLYLDAWFLRAAYLGQDLAAECLAQTPSKQLQRETDLLGAAMAKVLREAWQMDVADGPYPIVFGQAAKALSIPLRDTLAAFAHAYVANQISVACRVLPLGQTDGQRVLLDQEGKIEASVETWLAEDLADLPHSFTLGADFFALAHETQYSRMFRS